mmetsp:Transcript_12324/g.31964  ORF Transcript_12324/g.31964 Transcript_12324/m.31964 type:complete len:202 (-) Transcript_12324:341-946(-)
MMEAKYWRAGTPLTSMLMTGPSKSSRLAVAGSLLSRASAACWSFILDSTNRRMRAAASSAETLEELSPPAASASAAAKSRIWFSTTCRTKTSSSSSALASLADSATERYVGMPTMTNSVLSLSLKRTWASFICRWSSSSLSMATSPFDWPASCVMTDRKRRIFSMLRAMNCGSVSSRKVWPVGAVSITMRVNFSNSGFSAN